jgi:hypothetical protein
MKYPGQQRFWQHRGTDPAMHDLPPHPRSPQRFAERLLGETSSPTPEPSSAALARAQAGMRVPLVDLVRASQGAALRETTRVPPLVWLVPAIGVGAGATATGVSAFGSLAATAVAAAALYFGTRAVMLRLSPRSADAAPQMMEVAHTFDAITVAAAAKVDPALAGPVALS